MKTQTAQRMNLELLKQLNDNATVIAVAIELLGGHPSISEIASATRRSFATVYRGLKCLHDTGYPVALTTEPRPPLPPPPAKRRRYCITEKKNGGAR